MINTLEVSLIWYFLKSLTNKIPNRISTNIPKKIQRGKNKNEVKEILPVWAIWTNEVNKTIT